VGADVGEVVGVHVWPVIVGVMVVGLVVGQAVPSAVPPRPSQLGKQEYDVPTVPTLTRSPHSPALLYTDL
jgi:uncharacterized protein YwlG (UPF0340 family)